METTVSNPRERSELIIERESSAGWVVAVIVLLAVIGLGIYAWAQYRNAPAEPAQQSPGTNIEVTLPSGEENSGNGAPNQ